MIDGLIAILLATEVSTNDPKHIRELAQRQGIPCITEPKFPDIDWNEESCRMERTQIYG